MSQTQTRCPVKNRDGEQCGDYEVAKAVKSAARRTRGRTIWPHRAAQKPYDEQPPR